MNATAAQTKSLEWLNRLRANPKIPLIVAGSAAVAVMVALILWAKAPDYRTLFSNLSDQDGGAIVSQLTQMNIPYRFSEASGAIEVPADKVHELRLRLAQQGLPKGGAVGFELLDQEKFGISQFSEQVNYQRALEGELSRTIETIGPVKGARVHLAMPKPSLFVREQKSPSASVTVNLLPGRALDEGQISAIVHLVSSAVAGLPPGNVTLVDQGGHLLTQSNTSGRDLNDAQLKYASDVEGRIQRRIEAILSPIVGNGNIHAQVTAQLDFASKEQTEEQYRPNGDESHAALRSRQLNVSPLLRMQGAAYATRIAEDFRDRGQHVLLIMDSLTRYAMAQREIALAIGEPPATKGYPPSVFAKLPALVERAGNGISGGGSITAFYTVLTEGDDQQDPIADSARAILDGHIVLSRRLAEAGHYPAIDIEASISRAMTALISEQHYARVRTFKQLLSSFQRNRDLVSVGAYAKGSDPMLDKAIALWPQLEGYLQQGIFERADWEASLQGLERIFPTVS